MESVEQILEQFPKTTEGLASGYKSFVFQPNRLSVNSRQNLNNLSSDTGALYNFNTQNAYFNEFSCPLRTPILGLKSIELIRFRMLLLTFQMMKQSFITIDFQILVQVLIIIRIISMDLI